MELCQGDNIPVFLHAHLQVVYYNYVKFHKNSISSLVGVALTRYIPLLFVCLMVFNATFNNISVTCILWWSVLLLEETSDLPQVTDKLYHIMLYWTHLAWVGFKLMPLVVIGTDCIGRCKSNYHTIMATTILIKYKVLTDIIVNCYYV
jgi:hypothetical protein